MKKPKLILIIFATIIAALPVIVVNSCISEFEAGIDTDKTPVLVVSGDIIENTEVDFTLSKTFGTEYPAPPGESKDVIATVTVVGSDGSQSLPAISMGQGVYRLAIGELLEDVGYGVRIEYNGEVYTSELSKPLRTPEIKEISWEQPEAYGDVCFSVSTGGAPSDETQYFRWSYIEDWKFHARELTQLFYNYTFKTIRKLSDEEMYRRYYCYSGNSKNKILIATTKDLTENVLTNKRILDFPSSDDKFSVKYCLTLTQKAISRTAYEYYLAKRTENEEMGGIFTPQPNEVKGNIVCSSDPTKKTIGFVCVLKNVAKKRIFVDRKYLTRENKGCPYITKEEFEENCKIEGLQEWEFAAKYNLEPLGLWSENDNAPVLQGWVNPICVDCNKAGGHQNKPDFWPEEGD